MVGPTDFLTKEVQVSHEKRGNQFYLPVSLMFGQCPEKKNCSTIKSNDRLVSSMFHHIRCFESLVLI